MASLLAKLGIGIITKLMTEVFFSKLLVAALRAWAKQTENHYDNQVVEAIAEALGVDKDILVID